MSLWHMTRAPRQKFTGWVAHFWPNGCPEIIWGRILRKALISAMGFRPTSRNDVPWQGIGRSGDRGRTRNLCLPPRTDPNTYRIRENKDKHIITKKGTQPSQNCSGGIINTQLLLFFDGSLVVIQSHLILHACMTLCRPRPRLHL